MATTTHPTDDDARTGPDERRLVTQAAAGDSAALTGLVARHRPRLVAIARRITGCPSDAEDVVQDSLLKIWRNVHRLDAGRPFLPWASVVVRHVAIDHVRAEARARDLARRAERPLPAACPFATVDDRLAAEDRARDLGGLDEDRQLLTWIHIDGDTIAQVSRRLGVPNGTVKSRSARARSRLISRLTPAA